jgi:hypothetical protein
VTVRNRAAAQFRRDALLIAAGLAGVADGTLLAKVSFPAARIQEFP